MKSVPAIVLGDVAHHINHGADLPPRVDAVRSGFCPPEAGLLGGRRSSSPADPPFFCSTETA